RLRRLHCTRCIGGIIDLDDFDFVIFASRLNAALRIGDLWREIIPLLLLDAFGRQWPGQRKRSADSNYILCCAQFGSYTPYNQSGNKAEVEPTTIHVLTPLYITDPVTGGIIEFLSLLHKHICASSLLRSPRG